MHQKMAGYRKPAPEVEWGVLEQALAARRQRGRVVALWSRRVAAAAAVLLLAGVGYWAIFQQPEVSDMPEAVVAVQTEPSAESLSSVGVTAEQGPLAPLVTAIHQKRQVLLAAVGNGLARTDTMGSRLVRTDTVGYRLADADSEPSEPVEKVQQEETHRVGERPVVTPRQPISYPPVYRKHSHRDNPLTAKVYFSNSMYNSHSLTSFTERVLVSPGNSGTNNPGTVVTPIGSDGEDRNWGTDGKGEPGSQGPQEPQGEGHPDKSGGGNNDGAGADPYDLKDPLDQYKEPVYEDVTTSEQVNHYKPVRFGLSLRYRLNDHWSLESGLTYTRLSSDILTTVNEQTKSVVDQSLTYIGIPLSVSYRIWGTRYMDVYASAGGMVEKMVSGKRTSVDLSEKVSIGSLQCSVSGAVGAEFRFSDWFSIFAEPGLGYFFNNGSSVPTYYQERPLSFTLNFGLRLNVE